MANSGPGQVDVSPAELDRVARRAAIRANLKNEFNRKHYNPYRYIYHVDMNDPAVSRFMAAKVSRYDYWKPTWKSFFGWAGMTIVPVIAYGYYLKCARDEQERLYRSGAVATKDRTYKWTWVSSQIGI
jgi:hypothetical protein